MHDCFCFDLVRWDFVWFERSFTIHSYRDRKYYVLLSMSHAILVLAFTTRTFIAQYYAVVRCLPSCLSACLSRVTVRVLLQEAQLSPRDRAMRRVNWNLASCHATVQKLLIRQVLAKSMVWSWRFSWRQCVIDNVHSTMTRSSRLPLSQVS